MSATGHVIEVRRRCAVCLTCGRVGTTSEAIAHLIDTFLTRRAS